MSQYPNGFEPDRYLSRSWALLTRDSGWIKPVLVLTLVCFVPVIGPIAALGYYLEWARLTAWGVDAAPKQRKVNVGQVIASGWRGTVVALVWMLVIWGVLGCISGLLGLIPGESHSAMPDVLRGIYIVVEAILGLVVVVAQLRAAIYQRIAPGLRVDRVWDMAKCDFGGLMRMIGFVALELLIQFLIGLVFAVIAFALLMPYAWSLWSGSGVLVGRYALISMLQGMFSSLAPLMVIAAFVLIAVSVVFHMLIVTGVGLWMRQFDVPHWGKSSDPLPQGSRRVTNETPVSPSDHPASATTETAEQAQPSVTPTGYQTGPYRPDQPGDEGQAGQVPQGAEGVEDDGPGEDVEHLL